MHTHTKNNRKTKKSKRNSSPKLQVKGSTSSNQIHFSLYFCTTLFVFHEDLNPNPPHRQDTEGRCVSTRHRLAPSCAALGKCVCTQVHARRDTAAADSCTQTQRLRRYRGTRADLNCKLQLLVHYLAAQGHIEIVLHLIMQRYPLLTLTHALI